jgi:transcriptional regulator with XRE-family HTH domain
MENELLLTTSEWEQRIGTDVRRLRFTLELTQAELAERANVSLSSLKRLEAGLGSTLSTVIRVARALGRDRWLAELAPPTPSISPMALLREAQRKEKRPRRVRHRRERTSDS